MSLAKLRNGSEWPVRSMLAVFFQGASEDGSKVFFLSEQKLLDG
jgi:hypothetical protein